MQVTRFFLWFLTEEFVQRKELILAKDKLVKWFLENVKVMGLI